MEMGSLALIRLVLSVGSGLVLAACSSSSVQTVQGGGVRDGGPPAPPAELGARAPAPSPVVDGDGGARVEDAGATSGEGPGSGFELPRGVVELPLEGFNASAYVAPTAATPPPWPLIVVLHGNFDRPEWQCQSWAVEGGRRGWVLCPRGYPRADAPSELDRWTYKGRAKLAGEVSAGVAALKASYPDMVSEDESILIGFSLGANMAPRFVGQKVLPFRYLVLAEGGYQVTPEIARSAARRGVEKVVYLCGELTACAMRTKQLNRVWSRAGVEAHTVVMPGVGHGYPENLEDISRQTFVLLGL